MTPFKEFPVDKNRKYTITREHLNKTQRTERNIVNYTFDKRFVSRIPGELLTRL
jgi:hypothetical protein